MVIQAGVVSPLLAVRAGLRALLSAASASGGAEAIHVIFEGAGLADSQALPVELEILVVTEHAVSMDELRQAAQRYDGSLAVLLLGEGPQAAQMLAHLPLRAWGALTMETSADELTAAVRALHQGLWVGEPVLVKPAFTRFVFGEEMVVEDIFEPLTERESEVLQLLARGLANKQIAVSLGISEHTVKFHVSSIYTKLGATNRTEAVRKGVQQGLVLL
jgi:DNA-binding NarL/FixJ family response regulator